MNYFEFGINRNVKYVTVGKFLTTRTAKSLFDLVRTYCHLTLSVLVCVQWYPFLLGYFQGCLQFPSSKSQNHVACFNCGEFQSRIDWPSMCGARLREILRVSVWKVKNSHYFRVWLSCVCQVGFITFRASGNIYWHDPLPGSKCIGLTDDPIHIYKNN